MTGVAKLNGSCGHYVAFFGAPVTHAPQVLFAVARPNGAPYALIGRRAKDIVFRIAPNEGLPTDVASLIDQETVSAYVLYLPSEKFNEIRNCLKPRQAEDEKDL